MVPPTTKEPQVKNEQVSSIFNGDDICAIFWNIIKFKNSIRLYIYYI